MCQKLSMHIAAMKPVYTKQEEISEKTKQDILESEKGTKGLK